MKENGPGLDAVVKVVLDYLLACVALLFLSPLLLILALIVKLDSPGPVLYRRRVLGRGGGQFDALKFRTMVTNGDEVLAGYPEHLARWLQDQKLKDDPRVTRSGRWLRKLSLDELPQLINVVRSEISLVGPRMIAPRELAHYGDLASELLTVKPGLTGLWQISGRSDLERGDRVRLDLQYVRTRSVWMDVRLLLTTIPVVIRGRGAY